LAREFRLERIVVRCPSVHPPFELYALRWILGQFDHPQVVGSNVRADGDESEVRELAADFLLRSFSIQKLVRLQTKSLCAAT